MASSAKLCRQRAWVASAYVTSKQFEALIKKIPERDIDRKIFVRWQLRDLVAGASDLRAYELARENGWRFYVNSELHAKTYLIDDLCAVGSANLTTNGMMGVSPGNKEMLAKTTDLTSVAGWFMELESSSKELDDELFAQIEKAVQGRQIDDELTPADEIKYDESLLTALSSQHDFAIFTHDLFWSMAKELNCNLDGNEQVTRDLEHDFLLLRLNHLRERNQIGNRFLETKAFHWLLNNVKEQAYFGELSSKLHSSLQDDPAPYRKDVKILLNNLLEWTELFGGDYFTLDRPNVSQRITRK